MTHTQLSQLVQALLDAPKSNPTVKEFAQSWFAAEGTESLGEEGAANLLQHAKDLKAQGAEFCDCQACVAAKNIIDLKAEIM